MEELCVALLGADMNCYSVARAFHEAYGVKSHAFGRWPMGETQYSRIVQFTAVEDFENEAVILQTLLDFAAATPGKTRVVMGCTDDYATVLIRNKKKLQAHYIVPYIDEDLMEELVSKDRFYDFCQRYSIPYPATQVLCVEDDMAVVDQLPFAWPIIIKPSSSIQYWKHPFDGMRKVYIADSPGQARKIAGAIFASGYREALILQELIPGKDDKMRTLTAYCDRNAKVKMMCLGHVLLEEHTPKAVGNHAAILTEYDRPLMDRLTAFLEDIGYTGYANFDIKFDERDGQYKVFEVNLRQGRSNYYVTGAGLNIARYIVEDWIYQRDFGVPVLFDKETYWHSIPNKVVWQYTGDEALATKAMSLARSGQDTTALDYAFDLRGNLLRRLYLWEHYRRYHKKYATYCEKMRD